MKTVSARVIVLRWVKDMFYCPWRATATTAMVRSTMLVPTATIGAVRLIASVRSASASIAALP